MTERAPVIVVAVMATMACACCTPAPRPSAPPPDTIRTEPSTVVRGQAQGPAAATRSASATPSPGAPAAHRYGQDDLEALARQHAWSELVEHLEDIPPSARDQRWRELVANAAVGDLSLSQKTDLDRVAVAHASGALLRRYPSLRESAAFLGLHADVGITAVETCAAGSRWESCEFLVDHMEVVPDRTKSLRAGRAALARGNRPLAMALFRVASDPDPKPVCESTAILAVAVDGRSKPTGSSFRRDAEIVLERCKKTK